MKEGKEAAGRRLLGKFLSLGLGINVFNDNFRPKTGCGLIGSISNA